jgi:hypothetical protein
VAGNYVVFVVNDISGREHYWTGLILDGRVADASTDANRARRFHTAREAYREAGQYKRMQGFKVGVRKVVDIRKAA